jgi:hypothetical protein
MRSSTLTTSLAYLVLSATSAMAESHSPKIPATVNSKSTTSGWKTHNQPKVEILGEDSFTVTTLPATDLWQPDA